MGKSLGSRQGEAPEWLCWGDLKMGACFSQRGPFATSTKGVGRETRMGPRLQKFGRKGGSGGAHVCRWTDACHDTIGSSCLVIGRGALRGNLPHLWECASCAVM